MENHGNAGHLPAVATVAVLLITTVPWTAAGATAALPQTPIHEVKEEHFGTEVSDPYRWLEDTKSPEVVAWLRAENDYTRAVLDSLPELAGLKARIHALNDAGITVSNVQLEGNRVFYFKTSPGTDNRRLFVRDGFAGKERLLVDPEQLTAGGKHYSIDYFRPSQDGKLVAYGISPGGSEDSVLQVMDVDTGKVFGERISRTQYAAVSWLPDNRSFFYLRFAQLPPDAPRVMRYKKGQVYRHRIGADPDAEPPVFGYGTSRQASIGEDDFPYLVVIAGCPYVFGGIAHGVKNETTIYFAPLKATGSPEIPWRLLADVGDEVTQFDARGNEVFLLTHKNSPRFKIIKTSLAHPDLAKAAAVVPESEVVIRAFGVAKDALYVRDLTGAMSRLRRYPFSTGKPQTISLPYDGSISNLTADPRRPGAALALTSWTRSSTWFSMDPKNQLVDVHLAPPNPADFSEIASEEVKAPSADGTLVPLSIIYKKGLARDGSHPTLITGYGAYGITLEPAFNPMLLAWLERGGVYAVAHVRGGGDNGEDWHQAGMKLTKQNTIDDFVGCAKYLIDKKYTSSPRLAGSGTSAGGITIGGAITQHPELFAAAVDRVGVSDMIRFEISEGGPANTQEFGTIKTAEGFKGLLAMSAYHHVSDKTPYPAVMLTGGINDPRVPVWQPAKMTARLQAATSSGKPILLRLEYDAGHGLGSTKSQLETELADQYSFLLWQLGASKQIAAER